MRRCGPLPVLPQHLELRQEKKHVIVLQARFNQESVLYAFKIMVKLPWTSITVRAPRVILAPPGSFPRTSSTMSVIWALHFSTYAFGWEKKISTQVRLQCINQVICGLRSCLSMLAVDVLVDLKTDTQRVGLDGFRHFSSPKDGGGTNDNLARPLQHPLLPGHLQ